MPIPALVTLSLLLPLMAVDDTLGTVFDAHHVYNDATQITSITSATHPKLAVTLGYDDLYRLTTVTGGQSQSFTYSPVGNIETNSAISGSYQYGDPSKPHAATQAGSLQYGYDANGNVTSVTDRSPECVSVVRLMRWDAENQLSWVSNGSETVSYQYNANGSRIRRTGPSVGTTHYFGKVAEVQDPDGSPSLTKYYYAGDILVARQTNGVKEFYHQDHLDSVRALSDANGAQAVRYEYAAFGEEIENVGASANVHSFGAHRRDSESGLLYMGARYHDPVLGRFTQPDQVVPEPGDPQSWNRYSFIRNNPFNRIDPTGREDILQRFLNENFDVGATLAGAASRAVGGHDASASFFGSFGLSVVPGVGEVGDLGTLFSLDHNVGTGVRLLAAGSLVLSVATLGTSPNVGGSADELFEAGQEFAESAVTRGAKASADSSSNAAAGSDEVFEILDGVRRSKSAEIVGNQTVPARILDRDGRLIEQRDLPIESLRSPKESIDVSTRRAADRFFKRNLDPARAGSTPPPIEVTPGSRGTRIRDVSLDPNGVD